ncbi:MAG: macro domain-containing protein [Chloroflexi bacterium]|nr:macro domain-containing protein [Chloroflexota bacterium]
MVTVKIGDLFESQAQTIVNTVNCVGVMGKGVALEFKKRFPDMYEDYVGRCNAKQVKLGRPYLYQRPLTPWILNFPTKDHWRSVSRLQDIVKGLRYLKAHYKEWGITSLAVPPLGCGHGQLEWRVVGPTLYRHLKELDIPVELYAPFGTPHEELKPSFLEQTSGGNGSVTDSKSYKVEPAWVALVEILRRIEEEPYHWLVGRTTFQKIVYFATESGIPTGLLYQRGSYGPYTANLKQRITGLVNNGLIREERLGRLFMVRTGPTFEDARKAYLDDIEHWQGIIEKVADLFMRMNTQQAEVTATVHYTAQETAKHLGGVPTEKDILQAVMEWKQRRRPPLEEKDVALTIRHLNMLSWIRAQVSEDLPFTEEELLYV